MDEVIRVKEEFYVLASSTLVDSPLRVLKYGDTCGVFDAHGDIFSSAYLQHGLYHQETRHLSRFALKCENKPLQLLSSTVKDKNTFFAVDLTNLDFSAGSKAELPRGTIHLFRSKFIWENACYERVRIVNFASNLVGVSLSYDFDADFVDIFEVRGTKRDCTGNRLEPRVDSSAVLFAYRGLDNVLRETRLNFSPKPFAISSTNAQFDLVLEPHVEAHLYVDICCTHGRSSGPVQSYRQARNDSKTLNERIDQRTCCILSSNDRFNDWISRSDADLRMMTVGNPEGPYPYAGVPWFNTVFGRDGLITALEVLWVEPAVAKGVLQFLANTQADSVIPEQDAEPGKILHELRKGEMAATKEIPFGRYYGSVDSTPLFVLLAAAYYERTNDLEFIASIWDNIGRALHWIDHYGDADGDGFVEYSRRSKTGLIQQGWKDSHDSVFYENGQLAEAPIALCEVQGYVYAAKLGASKLARRQGFSSRADDLLRQATALQQKFEDVFWNEDLGTYVLALDGHKQPCNVTASNAGHCLFTRIASPERASRVADCLMGNNLFSGWGVRTVGTREPRYNPMSYHNGSVWPHDNALIALGLANYGFTRHALRVLESMFEASLYFELHRMPELFCGFRRRTGDGPTLYPVACSPQSWAAAAVYSLLQSSLGLAISATAPSVRFHDAYLPPMVDHVVLENLRVGKSRLSIMVRRQAQGVGIEVIRREGDVEVVIVK